MWAPCPLHTVRSDLRADLLGFEQCPVPGSHTPSVWSRPVARQTTGSRPVQTPAWQVSLRVHAFPSSHMVPLGLVGLEHTPLDGSHTPASWHWSPALQTTGSRPVQTPAWQVSLRVHAFPSSHATPSGLVGLEQTPVAGLHAPASRHWSPALQTTGAPPVQLPAWQRSFCVHAFPSSHAAPSSFVGREQTPVDGSQTPASWHWSAAPQTTDALPVQVPASHVSTCVQAFPSSQGVPSRF